MKKTLLQGIAILCCFLLLQISANAQSSGVLTSTSPSNNSQNGATTANVSATFNDQMIAPSASNTAMRVFGNKRGAYSYTFGGIYSGVNTTTITYNPTRTFFPGELLSLVNNANTTNGIINSRTTNTQFWAAAGVGTAQFVGPTSTTITIGAVSKIETADLDNDGDLDMVFMFTNASGYLSLASSLNNGAGLFATPTVIFDGYFDFDNGDTQINSFAVGDLNHDGDIDIVASISNLSIYVYSNNGAASFASSAYYKGENYLASQLTDMDGDGDLDYVCANRTAGTLMYYPNNGTGNFSAASTLVLTIAGLEDFVTGDFNNDRRMDIASTRNNSSFIRISLQLTTMGTFAAPAPYSTAGTGTSLAGIKILDVDGDGDLDLAVFNNNTNDNLVRIMVNNSAGVFTTGYSTGTTTIAMNLFDIADFDGDGDMDLFTSSNAVNGYNIYKNNAGTFTFFFNSSLGTQTIGAVATGDLDGDGDIDLATATSQLTTRRIRMLQNGSNTITVGTIPAPICVGSSVSIPFTSVGTFNSTNVYTALLSDATGSFLTPSIIGTLNSNANSGSIAVTMPPSAYAGTGYLIRITSSNPSAAGISSAFSITGLPVIALTSRACNSATATAITVSGATSYAWSPATGLNTTTGASIIATPSAPATYSVTGTTNGCSATATISVSNTCYCVGAYTYDCTSDDYINRVQVGTINNANTGCDGNLGNYIAYPSTGSFTTTLQAGGYYPLTLNPGPLYNQGFGVWIDFNRNGNFNDSSEFVYSVSPTNSPSTTISIPYSLVEGESVMRVRSYYGVTPTSTDNCNLQNYGETEDYKVMLVNPFTVTATNPTNSQNNVAVNSNTSATFSSNIGVVGVSRLHSSQKGLHFGTPTVSQPSIVFNPTLNYKPGERITVSLLNYEGTNGATMERPYQFEYFAAAGSGTARFQTLTSIASTNISDMVAGDFNGDGDIDYAVTRAANDEFAATVQTYNNNGSGTFSSGNTFALYYDVAIAAGDLDNDGDLDLVTAVSYGSNNMDFFTNNGAGVFTSSYSSWTTEAATNIELADMNGDGNLDIVCSNPTTGRLFYYRNFGVGALNVRFDQYQTDILAFANINSFTIGDFNNDGLLDVASGRTSSGFIRINYNNPNSPGYFQTAVAVFSGSINTECGSLKSVDFDGDGDLDIIATKPNDGTVIIVKNNYPATGAGSYSLAQTLTVNAAPKLIEVADFDGDGDMDIYVAHAAAAAKYISNNAGTFAVTTNATGGSPAIICSADFDGDGDIDIVGKTTAAVVATPITFIENAEYTVTASALSSPVCAGGYLGIGRVLSPTTWPSTTFTAELSNATGSFASPVILGTVTATTGYSGGFAIPSNTPAGAGYRVRWTNTLTGSTVVQSGVFTVTVLSPFNVSGGGAICQGSSATITLSGSTAGIRYRLKRNGNPIDSLSGNGSALNFTSSIVGVYTIEAFNTASFCTSDMNGSATITINPLPNSYGVYGGGNYCATDNGVPISLSSSSTGITYELLLSGNPTGITLAGTGSNLSFQNITTAGTYTIRGTNNSTGCQRLMNSSVTVTITASVPVSVTISPSANPICVGQSLSFTAVPVNEYYPVYYWKVNGVTDANSSSTSTAFTPSAISNGDIVTLEMFSGTYCGSPTPAISNAVTMTVNPNVTPTINVTGSNSICSGQSVTYTANITNGGTTPNYRWRVGGTVVQNGASNTYTTTTLTNGQIVRCELTSNANCASPLIVNSNNITVTVTPTVTPSVTISTTNSTVCAGTSILFTSNVVNGGPTPFYQWRINGTPVSGANSSTFNSSTLTNGQQVSLQMTSNAACASPLIVTSTAITITILPVVSPSISVSPANNPLCSNGGAFTTFTASIANGGVNPTINWFVNGTFQSGGANQTTFSSYSYSNGDVVTATLISTAACANPSSVGSNAFPIIVNTATSPVITETPIGTLNSTSAVDYQWYLNGSPIVSANNQTYNYLSVGNYTVEITDTVGCTALSNTYSVGVPTITVSPIAGPFCPGNTLSVAYTVSSSFILGNTFTAQLSNASGSFASPVNIGSINSINNGTIAATIPGGTPFGNGYRIRVVANNPTASSTPTSAFTINAITTAGVTITANPSGIQCAGTAITYTATPVNGGAIPQYQWLVNSSPVGANSPTFTSSALNNGDIVKVVLTSNLACVTGSPVTSAGITQLITPTVTPSVSISGSNSFCQGATANYSSSITNGGASPQYQWKVNGSNIAGATSASFSSSTLNNGDIVSIQLTSNAVCVTSSVVQSNNLTIIVNPNPAVLTVVGGGYLCSGTGSVPVSLNASQIGVDYTLIQLPTTPISTINGTGNAISFTVNSVGTYTIEANSTSGCNAAMNGNVTVSASPAPTQFALSGTSPICSNTQTSITLSGSQSGNSYQLFENTNPVSTSIAGNGSPINFGTFQNAATYSVKITNNTTLCVDNNTAQFVLIQNPVSAVFNLSGTNSICANLDVAYALSGSAIGFKYILQRNGVSVDTVAGTGTSISFSPVNTAGTYTCIAVNNTTSCTNNMNGAIALTTLPVPLTSYLNGPSSLCQGSSAIVTLATSELGVSYELFNDFGTTGLVRNGTNDSLQFPINTPSSYYVIGTNANGCESNVGFVSITSNSTAQTFDVLGGGTICTGEAGAFITLSNSESSFYYSVLLDGNPIGTYVSGTNLSISFGPFTDAGTYTIEATDFSCNTEMNGSAQIILLPSLPTSDAGSYQSICANNTVMSANNPGVGNTGTWSVLNGSGTFSNLNDPNASVGNISFGTNSYLWTISNGICTPKVDTVAVFRNNLPTVFASTGGGAFCQGASGVSVGLNGSQGAVQYTLAVNSIPLSSLYGSGAALNFGLQTTSGNYAITATDTVTGCPATMSGVIIVTETPTPAAPVLSIVDNCGSSVITASGFTGTLTWSPVLSGNPVTVLSGSYTVQQTVSGCISASSNTVTANPTAIPAMPILSVTNGCQFSSVTASGIVGTLTWVDGGTGNPRINLPAGTYAAYQTQNGCKSDTAFVVTNPIPAPATPLLSVVDNCGSSTITISGLTNPFTWTDGGTGNPRTVNTAGTYAVFQTASGCNSDTANISANPIAIPSAPTLSIVNNCGNSEITAIGVTGTLNWSDVGTGNPRTVLSGTYTVSQTENGCTSANSNSVTATPNSNPLTSVISGTTTPNCNATAQSYSVVLTAGSSYAWTVPFGATIVSGATGPNNNSIIVDFATSNGNISVIETNSNSCIGATQNLAINLQGCGVVIDFTASSDTLCSGLSTTFTNTTSGPLGATTFNWNFGAGASPATAIGNGPHSVTYTGSGPASVTLTLSGNVTGSLTKTDFITVHPAITNITYTTFNETCTNSNGSAAITNVTGGTPSYLYDFNGSGYTNATTYFGLGAGLYPIVVLDNNGCVYSDTIAINNTAGPTGFTPAITAASCGASDGSIQVNSVIGGTAPYTYSEGGGNYFASNLINNLSAATWNIFVQDATGCTFNQLVTVGNVGGLSVSLVTTDETCGYNNGQITSNVSGGTLPYSYVWSTGDTSANINGLNQGSYTVTVQDALGCIGTTSDTIFDRDIVLSAIVTNETCGNANGGIDVTASNGGGTYFYNWSNGAVSEDISGLSANTYTVFVSDNNGCSTNDSYTISNSGSLTASVITSNANCGQLDGQIEVDTVSGGTLPYEYSLDNISFVPSNIFTGLAAGNYTVYVKDAASCAFSQAVVLSNISGISAIVTAITNETCTSGNGAFDVTSVTGGTSPYSYSIDGVNSYTTSLFTGLSEDNYTIFIKDANNCIFTQNFDIFNFPAVDSVSTIITDATCGSSNGTIQVNVFSGGTAPFLYSIDGTNYSPTNQFSSLSAGSYTVFVSDSNNCVYSKNISINNTTAVTAITTTQNNSTCGAANGSFEILTITGGAAPYLFSTDGTNYNTDSSFTFLAAGSYTIYVQDDNSCLFTQGFTINNTNGVTAIATTIIDETCNASNGSIEITSVTGGTAPFSYSIDGVTYGTNTIFAGLAHSAYMVYVQDDNFCVFSQGVGVDSINPSAAPFITTLDPLVVCDGNTITLTSSYATGNVWSTGDTTSSITISAAGTSTIDVTHTDVNSCTATSLPITVTVNALPATPAITASGATTFCDGGSVDLTSSYGFGNTWSTGDTASAITVSTVGINTITLTHTDINGCSTTSSPTVVTVNALPATPVIASSGATTFCDGGSVDLTSSYNFGNVWSTTETTNTITVSALGVNTIDVTHTDVNGCSSTSSPTVVTVNALPAAPAITASGALTFCDGGSVDLTSSYGFGNTWSTGDTASAITVSTVGVNTITLTHTDVNGCSSTSTPTVVTVNALPATPIITASGATTFCDGGSVDLTSSYNFGNVWSTTETTNIITVSALGVNTISLTHTDVNGCSTTSSPTVVTVNALPATPIISASGTTTFCDGGSVDLTSSYGFGNAWSTGESTSTISVSAVGVNAITLTHTDVNGCTSTSVPTVVTVNALPATPVISASGTTTFCDGGSVDLTSSYNFGNVWSTTETTNTITVSALGVNTITLTHTDVNGCSSTSVPTIVTVNALPAAPIIAASGITTFCDGGSVDLTSSYNFGNLWSTAETTNTITVSALGVNTIDVTHTDINGCTSTSLQTIVTVNALPVQPVISAFGPLVFCDGGSVQLASNEPSGNTWSTLATSQSITVTASGNYSVSYTDVNGCSQTSNAVQVLVNTPIPATLNLSNTIACEGSASVVLDGGLPLGGSYIGSGVINNILYPALLPDGVYAIDYVVNDINGCASTASQNFVIDAAPLVNVTASQSIVCVNSTMVSLTGTPAGGTYSGVGVVGNMFDPTIAGAGIHTITYDYTAINGCSAQSTTTIVVNALPQLTLLTQSNLCENGAIVTLNNGFPAGGTYEIDGIAALEIDPSVLTVGNHTLTYIYSPVNGCGNSISTVFTINASPIVSLPVFASICSSAPALVLNSGLPSGGSYIGSGVLGGVFYPNLANPNNTITYYFTDVNGCTANASQNIDVLTPQAISFAALAPICINEPAFALNNASPAGGTYAGQGVVGNTFDAALAGPGLHVISYEVVGLNGCLAQATQTVMVNGLPQITALQPAALCGNSSAITLNFAQPSGGLYSGVGVSAGIFDPTVSGAGTFAITYSYTNNNGCTNTSVQNITVNAAPVVLQTAYADVCSNSGLIQLNNGSPLGGNYIGNFVNNGTFNSSLSGAGTFNITYQYVDTNGCSAQAISSITVNALPVLSLTTLGNLCSGSGAITLSNGLPAGGTYYGLGVNAGVLDPTLVPAGAQQLGYTITDANGCTDSTSITYSIYNLQANAGIDQSITCTTSANLQGQSNYSGLSPLTYSWSPTIGLSSPNSQNTTAMPSASTNYVLTVSDGVCTTTDTVLVNVAPSNFNLSAMVNSQVFNNPPFIVFFTNNTPSPANYSFEWSFGDGTTYNGFQPIYHNYTNNGVYSVTLIATALGSGCVDTLVMSNLITCNNAVICNDSANIIVNGVLIPNNSNYTTSICANSNFTLNSNTDPNYSYQWYYNGIPLQNGLTSSFTPNVTGYYTVGVENNNCINLSSPVYITVLPLPNVPFITSTGSNNFCAGGSLTLQASAGYASYLWSTGETQATISVNTSGNYWVQGFDANGCKAQSLDFAVNGSIMLPQYICVTTVDTVSNKNRIIWEKPVTTSIDSFLVYRETVLAGVYQQIGSVDYNDNSEFIDLTSNPDVSSNRYRLAIKDSCGNNTTQGDIHGTIKSWLTPLGNGTDSVEVFFTKYVGIDSLTYTLYRGSTVNNMVPVGSAYSFTGNANIHSIKDLSIPAYPAGYAFYQVRANLVNLCNSDSTAYQQSISNTVSIGNSIGINEHNSVFTVNAFPNPNNGSFQIALESNTVEDVSLIIYNQMGAIVWKSELERTIGKTVVSVPLEFAAQGVYQLQVTASKKTINKRIIISK